MRKTWSSLKLIIINGIEYANTQQAAAYLGIHEVTLKNHAGKNKLVKPDVSLARTKLYTRETLDALAPHLCKRGERRDYKESKRKHG